MENTNVEVLADGQKTIYLVKTAHISAFSVQDVTTTIAEVQPDQLAIELDSDRLEALQHKERWQNTDIVQVIKENKVGFLLANMILASFQRRMAKKLENTAGGEMSAAIQQAQKYNLPLHLIDRPVKITFSRIWNSLGLWEKAKLASSILLSLFTHEEISEEELSTLKQQDVLETALAEIGKEFPVVKRILVDERDRYLAQKIKEIQGSKIVAVVGAAHAPGIKKYLQEENDLTQLEKIPAKKKTFTLLKWFIPLALVIMVIYTIRQNQNVGLAQLRSWILWNGGLSALGTLLAGGHLFSICTALFLAPITSLNPLLAVGWFTGLVQASVSRPRVSDFESLSQDTENWKGFWRNKVTRVLLVVLFSNLFSTIGTFVSGSQIILQFLQLFH